MDLSNFIRFYVNEMFNEPVNIPVNIATRQENRQENRQATRQATSDYETDKFRPKEPDPTEHESEIIEFNWEGFDITNTIKIHLSTV